MDIPQGCLSFSPNWFYPQIVLCTDQLLIYGANDSVYLFNHNTKRFLSCIHQGVKVTLLHVHNQTIFVGQEGGAILIYDLSQQPPKYKGKIELNVQNVHLMQTSHVDPNSFIVFDDKGVGVQFKLKDYQICHFTLKVINQPLDKPKFFIQNEQQLLVFYEKGIIFSTTNITIQYPFKILYVDVMEDRIVILTKKSSKLGLHIIYFSTHEVLINTLNKWNNYQDSVVPIENMLGENEKYFFLRIVQNDKLPSQDKASLTVIWMKQNMILISSKQGEFFSLNLANDIKFQEVKLNPSAMEQEKNELIQGVKLPLDSHYKPIFLTRRVDKLIYSVGVDRRIALHELNDDGDLELKWRLNLLGNRVSVVKSSPTEPNILFFTGHDMSLKSMDLSKKHDGCYVNEFWKSIPKFDDFYPHPEIEGVVAFKGDDKKISNTSQYQDICDIYKESQIVNIQCLDSVSQVFWMEDVQPLLEVLKLLSGDQTVTNQQLKIERTDLKHLKRAYNLLNLVVLTSAGQIIIIDLGVFKTLYQGSIVQSFSIAKLLEQSQGRPLDLITVRTQLVKINQREDYLQLILVLNSNFLANFIYHQKTKKYHVDITTVHTQITCLDQIDIDGQNFVITGGQDKNIGIHVLQDNKLILLGFLQHRFPIQRVKMSQHFQVLAIARQHPSLQIWTIKDFIASKGPHFKDSQAIIEKVDSQQNIRGHLGFLIDATFYPLSSQQVITSSDDQTLKVWDLTTIENKNPPNKKKKNKNQQAPQKDLKKIKLNDGTHKKK